MFVSRLFRGTVLVVASFAAGCGGSICDRAGNQQKVINDKVKGCPQIAGSVTTGGLTKSSCESKLQSPACSDNDRTLYDNMFTCIEELEPCLSGQEQAFITKFSNCRLPLQGGRTTSCKEALP